MFKTHVENKKNIVIMVTVQGLQLSVHGFFNRERLPAMFEHYITINIFLSVLAEHGMFFA